MAEKPEELNIRDIKLLEYNIVSKGIIKLDNQELSFFEKETWKLFVSRIGWRILDEKKEKLFGECMIQFYPLERKKLIESAKQNNKTFLMKTLIKPLFFINYDRNQHIEFIDRSGERIPHEVFFMVLCR